MNNIKHPKIALTWQPGEGKRNRGWSKETWRKAIEKKERSRNEDMRRGIHTNK